MGITGIHFGNNRGPDDSLFGNIRQGIPEESLIIPNNSLYKESLGTPKEPYGTLRNLWESLRKP